MTQVNVMPDGTLGFGPFNQTSLSIPKYISSHRAGASTVSTASLSLIFSSVAVR